MTMQSEDQDAAFIAGADATPVSEPENTGTPEPAPKEPAATEAQPEGELPPADKEGDGEGEGETKKAQKDALAKRFAELTKRNYDKDRENAALREELARVTGAEHPTETEEQRIQREATHRAQQMVLRREHEQRVANWEAKADNIDELRAGCNQLYDLGAGQRPEFVQILLDTEHSQKVVAELANDPDKAMRILAMPPHKMAIEIDKMAAKLAQPAPKPVSNAPPPINPISGHGRVQTDPEKMTMPEWMKWHDEQQAKRGR